MRPGRVRIAYAAALLFGLSAVATAQTGVARIDDFKPRGGRAGTEVAIEFTGQRLKDLEDILFFAPGARVVAIKAVDERRAVARVALEARPTPAVLPFMLRTRAGLSALKILHVGVLAETDEVESNRSDLAPQDVVLDRIVNGSLDEGDIDRFRVALTAGESAAIEVIGVRLGGKPYDPMLVVFDPEGRRVAASEDSLLGRMDPIVVFRPALSGPHVIEVRETTRRGDSSNRYRLAIGRFPRPELLYPLGANPGALTAFRHLGTDEGAVEWLRLDGRPGEIVSHWPQSACGIAPTPIRLALFHGDERSDDAPGAPPALPPCAFNGVISKRGEIDEWPIRLVKGKGIRARVLARAFRSPLDPVLEIVNDRGRAAQSNDDAAGHPDSVLTYQPREDGIHVVRIRDQLLSGSSLHAYRIEIAEPVETRETSFVPPRGFETFGVTVPAGGRAGFALRTKGVPNLAEVRAALENLPAGVEATVGAFRPTASAVPVLVSAGPEAPRGAGLARLVGRRARALEDLAFAAEATLTEVENRRVYVSERVRAIPLGVGLPQPFRVEASAPTVPLVRSSPLGVKIKIHRDEGFAKPLTVRALWLPPGVSGGQVRVDAKETEATLALSADDVAAEGSWDLAVTADTGEEGAVPVASEFVTLVVAAPLIQARIGKARGEVGSTLDLEVKIDAMKPAVEAFVAEFQNLPRGVQAEPIALDAQAKSFITRLVVAPDAPPCLQKNLLLRLRIASPDGEIVQQQKGGEIRIDAPLGERPAGAPDPKAPRGTLASPKT